MFSYNLVACCLNVRNVTLDFQIVSFDKTCFASNYDRKSIFDEIMLQYNVANEIHLDCTRIHRDLLSSHVVTPKKDLVGRFSFNTPVI